MSCGTGPTASRHAVTGHGKRARRPEPSEADLIPRDWGDDITPDEVDLAYGPETGCPEGAPDHECGGSQELDVYLPRDGGMRGTIVYFHGGGFATGDKSDVSGLGNIKRQLARGFGLVVANYRLTDASQNENGFPDAMADVGAAIDWVKTNGPDHGLPTDVIVAAGGSAGGTLAALAGTAANSSEPVFADLQPVDGWMSISGVMTWKGGEMSDGWMQGWLGPDYLEQRDVASATNHLDFDDPPGYLAHGAADSFVETDNADLLEDEVSLLNRLLFWRDRGKLTIDIVDNFADGPPMDDNTGHQPIGGANSTVMDEWLDDVVDQAAEQGS
ncbi:MAG: alpha/beta hydrolase fold domain-containing protein [Acidimicrobiales bacterium]